MPNIMTIVPEQARGIRKLFFRWVSHWLAVFVEVIRGPAPAPLGRADAQ